MDGGVYVENQRYEIVQPVTEASVELDVVPAGEIGYRDSVDIIRKELNNIKQSFLAVGWHLKYIKDGGLYKEDGYTTIYDFASDKFHMSQSNVSRYINLCERFSVGNGSFRLDKKYEGFDYSQLTEMLPMKPEEQEKVTPDMTVRQIREMKKKGKKKILKETQEEAPAVPGQVESKEYATSHTEDAVEIPLAVEESGRQMPELDSDDTREQWLIDVEAWGLWYEDPNIQARYYKYDFPDGSRLVAVKYRYTCPPFMLEDMSQYQEETEADGDYYGEPVYHMIYSDDYWDRHPEEYQREYKRYYTHDNTQIDKLVQFLQELYDKQSSKELPFVTRQYIEFYKKHNYIPKYFNVKDGTEVADYAHVLATGSGSDAGTGSIAIFDIQKNIEAVINDKTIDVDEQEDRIKKLLKIAKPEERDKAVKKLLEWREERFGNSL